MGKASGMGMESTLRGTIGATALAIEGGHAWCRATE